MKKAKNESFLVETAPGINIYAEKWYPAGTKVKGIVQIAHGMRESTAYYTEFIRELTRSGYGVYIHDARGHGQTAGKAGPSQYDKNAGNCRSNAIEVMADDLNRITELIKQQNPGVPVYLLGHSMGSVVSRVYAYQYGAQINGLIYSGTTGPTQKEKIGRLLSIAEAEAAARGLDAAAKDTPQQMFAGYNDCFEKTETGYEYMSRDEDMVRLAVTSPYANVPYRCGFYVDFLTAILGVDTAEHIERIPKSLPIYSVSGSMDPFGDYGKGVPELFSLYEKHGIKDISYKIYPGGRHEMLRETNRAKVFRDIIGWLACHP